MRIIVIAGAVLAAGAAYAEEPGFLFDALRLPKYHMAWDRLVKDVEPTPDWLRNFSRSLDGAAGEVKTVTIDGKPFKLSYVCKPEDCEAHKFEVLFDESGARAFGALGGKDEVPAFYGSPDQAQQDALTKAIHPVASAETPQPKSE